MTESRSGSGADAPQPVDPAEPEGFVGRLLARWVDAVRRRAAWVVGSILLLTAVVLPPAVARLDMHVDPLSMLRPDLPYQQLRREYFQAFPRERHTLLVVIDGATADAAHDAMHVLVDRLRSAPAHFPGVFAPGSGEFFERHGLLYRETEELEDLADRLAEFQPYLAALALDPSLRGFFDLLGDAVERADATRSVDLARVLDRATDVIDARAAGTSLTLSWQDLLFGAGGAAGGSRRLVVIQPTLDTGNLQLAREPILALREIVAELGFDGVDGRPRARITGDLALNFDETQVVREQGRRAGILSFLLVTIILTLALRSPIHVLFTALTLLVGLGWTVAFAAVAIGHLNMVSVAFAVLFIGLGVDFGIHLCLRFRELRQRGSDAAEALRLTASDVGASLLLCALTTAIGFYAFAPTDYLGVAELGVIAGTGMFISVFFTLTLLPALLSLRPGPIPDPRPPAVGWRRRGLDLPTRRAGSVVFAAAALAVAAAWVLPDVEFDYNPLRVRDPSTESVTTFEELLEDGTTSPWTIEIVEPDVESADRLARQVAALDPVERAITVADFVPAAQREKLAILADAALLVGPALDPTDPLTPPDAAQQRVALEDLTQRVEDRLASGAPEALRASLERLRAGLAALDEAGAGAVDLAALESDLLGNLPGRLRLLRRAFEAGPVSLADLPAELRDRMLSADGRARVQVLPAADVSDNAEMAQFVAAVSEVTPRVTGPAPGFVAAGDAIVGAFRQALVSAILLIALLLFLLWRRTGDTLLVLVPLLLAAALTSAAGVVVGIPFNFADVIVVPLLLGIGVDSGIHLVHRARSGDARAVDLLRTSTARAVFMSALTTIASFGALALATHRGMSSMGRLLTLGVLFMLVCNLVVLPALIELSRRRAGVR